MKILFFQRWVGVREGGTETEIKELSRFMAERGHKVYILTLQGNALYDFDGRVKIIPLRPALGESFASYHINDPRLYLYTFFYILQSFLVLFFFHFLKGIHFDLISVHFYTEAKVARFFRFITKTPYVFVLEGYTDREAGEAKYANVQFCISRYDQELCRKNFGYRPILKPIGAYIERFEARGSKFEGKVREKFAKDDEFLCLTVCRLEPRKDLPTLIEAAKILKSENPQIKFLIAGEGISERELKRQVESLGLQDTVFFAGRVSDENLPKYYRAANLFVLPTLYEGFGIVFLEAMASGLPILSTKVGAVPEVVSSCGVLIKPKDSKALAENILRLANDKNRLAEMKGCGLTRVKEKFDQEKLLRIFEENCLKLLK